MSAVLVTGGSGFLGQHLVSQLLARGERVRVLDLAPPEHLPAGVEFLRGSILDEAILGHAMAQVRHMYHLAGIAQLWVRDKADFDRVNGRGTEMVLRSALERQVERVIHCSTESILLSDGRAPDAAVDESAWATDAAMPGPYTRSKHVAEEAALTAARSGLDVVIVNPTVPIGPNDRNMTPPAAMLSMFLTRPPPVFLDCILNLVDVRDVAAGMLLAAERGRSGERYILGGENVSLRELLRSLERLSGRRMPARVLPAPMAFAAAAVQEWIADRVTGRPPRATREGVRLALRSAPFDSRKARAELGYAPRPIENALADAVRWLSDDAIVSPQGIRPPPA